jgi:hypothetical protein
MRWYEKPKPQEDDTRTRDGFLWWPCHLSGETRWLEWASWLETYQFRWFFPAERQPFRARAWCRTGWL